MFKEYYKKYLGFCENNLQEDLPVFSSECRDKLFSFTYKNPIIATKIQRRIIFSVVPKYFGDFCKYTKNFNQLDFESLDFQKKIDDFFAINYSSYFTIDRYYRMTVDFAPYHSDPERSEGEESHSAQNRLREAIYNNYYEITSSVSIRIRRDGLAMTHGFSGTQKEKT